MEKRYLLDLGDLIGNLFLILMENEIDVDKITYSQIEQFREILEKEAENNEMKLSFKLSRDLTAKFFSNNRSTFDEQDDRTIIIKEGITPIHLIYDYRSSLPLDVALLISSDEVTNKTLDMMGYEKAEKKSPEDIEYYINRLKKLINSYASKMEFEKCIELREKLHRLNFIQNLMNRAQEETKSEKGKTYIKINKDKKSQD